MDLDLRDCFGRVKQNFIGMIQLFVVILEGNTSSASTLLSSNIKIICLDEIFFENFADITMPSAFTESYDYSPHIFTGYHFVCLFMKILYRAPE